MDNKAEKLLVVESDDNIREQIVAVLSNAGFEHVFRPRLVGLWHPQI